MVLLLDYSHYYVILGSVVGPGVGLVVQFGPWVVFVSCIDIAAKIVKLCKRQGQLLRTLLCKCKIEIFIFLYKLC